MDNTIDYELFDVNNFKVEKKETIFLKKVISESLGGIEIKGDEHYLKHLGLSLGEIILKIHDKKKLLDFTLKTIFPDCKIIDRQYGTEAGVPDFLVIDKDGHEINVELKIGDDSIRHSQLIWFSQNKNKDNKILYLYFNLELEKGVDYNWKDVNIGYTPEKANYL